MFLVSTDKPLASYLQLADLKADASLDLTDRKGVALPDSTLNAWLVEHSGEIDTLIGQSFLPQQETVRLHGDGSMFLWVGRYPIIYVRQAKIVLPNSRGFDIPVQSLLIDQWNGVLENMTPLTFQGVGITTLFPKGVPIDLTVAWGIGWPVPPPNFTASAAGYDSTNVGASYTGPVPLDVAYPAGTYSVALTSVTVSGESLPSPAQTVTLTSPGAISVRVINAPGALRYYVYVNGLWTAELQGYAIGAGTVAITFDATPSTNPIALGFDGSPSPVPTIDNSAIPFQGRYAALPRLMKLLIQMSVWEEKNPSNQGVARMTTGPKSVQFKDNIQSTLQKRISALYDSLQFQGIA